MYICIFAFSLHNFGLPQNLCSENFDYSHNFKIVHLLLHKRINVHGFSDCKLTTKTQNYFFAIVWRCLPLRPLMCGFCQAGKCSYFLHFFKLTTTFFLIHSLNYCTMDHAHALCLHRKHQLFNNNFAKTFHRPVGFANAHTRYSITELSRTFRQIVVTTVHVLSVCRTDGGKS